MAETLHTATNGDTSSAGKTLCLTVYSYKKEGLSDEEYREYMLKTHAPLASKLMEKYGITDFTMVTTESPILLCYRNLN